MLLQHALVHAVAIYIVRDCLWKETIWELFNMSYSNFLGILWYHAVVLYLKLHAIIVMCADHNATIK